MNIFKKEKTCQNVIYMSSDLNLFEHLLTGEVLNCRNLATHKVIYHKFMLGDKLIELETKMNDFKLNDSYIFNNKSEQYYDWYIYCNDEDNPIMRQVKLIRGIKDKLSEEETNIIRTYGKLL